ncbi:hypothetical protein ACFB49_10620 [Sphingomonas sp. DBB INV C78]|uniref:tetratricopeptide repeat protein n=1 Tax=Sphingomonas sp. DBB INV C78 TaxID=3349434 RepID=UPI0036D398CF
MIYFAFILLVQILCIAHVVKRGRNKAWIMAIMMLPLAGGLAYFLMEVAPAMMGNRHVRAARAAAVHAIDPERELRVARDRLELADTVDARIRVGDALAGLERWNEAISIYREALDRFPADHRTEAKLARALFEAGDAKGTLAIIEKLPAPSTIGDADRTALLRARALEHLGRNAEALAIYEDIVTRFPGEEARCRYAALLISLGAKERARDVLTEVEERMRRLDRARRAAEADMYDWAERTLQELRA